MIEESRGTLRGVGAAHEARCLPGVQLSISTKTTYQ